jgi:dolichol-phosphate mannosyltransferase
MINKNQKHVPKYTIQKFAPKKSNTALVIPVINEGQRILLQLKRIASINPRVDIIIADGGSSDGTLNKILEGKMQITTFLQKKDEGKLSAQLRMGFDFCLKEDYDFVITMDGNNKDGEKGIEVIQNALVSGFDFVQGSRFIKGGEAINTPLGRLLAIRLIHAPITSIAAGFWYTDTTNGFRGHSARLLNSKELSIFRGIFQTYELIAYIPIQSRRLGFSVTEVPVTRAYPAFGVTPTKINGLKGQINLMKILIMAALGSYSSNSSD